MDLIVRETDSVIVSRHPAAVEFIIHCLSADASPTGGEARWSVDGKAVVVIEKTGPMDAFVSSIPVVETATPEDVRGKVVYGNVPLRLAVLAKEVRTVEFTGTPPRGQEYSLEDMVEAGAEFRSYRVIDPDESVVLSSEDAGYIARLLQA